MNWLLTIKAKLIALGAMLLAVAAAVLRHRQVVAQRDRAREAARVAEREVKERREIAAAETEIESNYSDARREAERDVKDGLMPDAIRNRNRR